LPIVSKTVQVNASPEVVFSHLDDIRNVGQHMSERSMALMGNKLELSILDGREGVGAIYAWKGEVLWMPIDIKETVTRWVENREKSWRTTGEQKIIILDGYEMRFSLSPWEGGTKLSFEIEYTLPRNPLNWVLGRLLASWYCRWCLNNVVDGAKEYLEQRASN